MILFVEKPGHYAEAQRAQRIFYKMYIPTYIVPSDEIERIEYYPANAIIIACPQAIEDLADVCHYIREHLPLIPLALFFIPPCGNYYTYTRLADFVFEKNTTSIRVVKTLFEEREKRTGAYAFIQYTDAVFTDIKRAGLIFLYGLPERVTHRQFLIVRYLLLKAPACVSAEELLDICAHPLRKRPTINTIGTQVCLLNQISCKAIEHYHVIGNKRGVGYYLADFDPERQQTKKR